ncbi:MAG TPA: hypothetical protein VED20_00390 [Streptosporangiaceae bacterium]|nr:hypothetical protein [Streptosporangiaceae bacterium]
MSEAELHTDTPAAPARGGGRRARLSSRPVTLACAILFALLVAARG